MSDSGNGFDLKKQNFRDRVILIDLVCHGVASSNLWKEYIKS